MYTVAFQSERRYAGGMKALLRDYSWWKDLVGMVAARADSFVLRCWPEEPEALALGRRFGSPVENTQTREMVFRGPVTEDFLREIRENGFDETGCLKWFTLIFYKRDVPLFSSEHYGAEPYLFMETREEVEKLRAWCEKYPVITRVDVFEG